MDVGIAIASYWPMSTTQLIAAMSTEANIEKKIYEKTLLVGEAFVAGDFDGADCIRAEIARLRSLLSSASASTLAASAIASATADGPPLDTAAETPLVTDEQAFAQCVLVSADVNSRSQSYPPGMFVKAVIVSRPKLPEQIKIIKLILITLLQLKKLVRVCYSRSIPFIELRHYVRNSA